MSASDNTISLAEAKRRMREKEQSEQMASAPAADTSEGLIPLGHDQGVFFYLSRSGKQILPLKPDQHTRLALTGAASSAHYWERQQQFRDDKGAVNWHGIADHLMQAGRAVGIYNPDIVRGRGAWIDAGRSILHLGDRLIVDGAPQSLDLAGSKFVYQAARALHLTAEPPLELVDARKLLKITAALRWERTISAKLLAGWIAIAPICGALAWRPSIWLTGAAGAGKSWIFENIIAPSIGPIALQAQSKTTEAYLRQALGSDAKPVMFDEAEREDQASAMRMQSILDLMRQSSSAGGAPIGKGGANGKPTEYRIRSAFLFQSINVGLKHAADESRVTVLSLRDAPPRQSATDAQAFADLRVWCAETITPTFSAALIARMTKMIPAVCQSAEIFAQAIAATLGTRRQGDQLGTLLAGAWALHSDDVVTLDQAKAFVSREEFADSVDAIEDRDEARCLRHLLAHRTRVQGNEHSFGSLIEAVRFSGLERPAGLLLKDSADRALRLSGIKVEERSMQDQRIGLFISGNHPDIARALVGTPWDTGWSRTLARTEGAESGREVKPQYFTATHNSRAVWLPIEIIEGGCQK